jgi:hypothetical protein
MNTQKTIGAHTQKIGAQLTDDFSAAEFFAVDWNDDESDDGSFVYDYDEDEVVECLLDWCNEVSGWTTDVFGTKEEFNWQRLCAEPWVGGVAVSESIHSEIIAYFKKKRIIARSPCLNNVTIRDMVSRLENDFKVGRASTKYMTSQSVEWNQLLEMTKSQPRISKNL